MIVSINSNAPANDIERLFVSQSNMNNKAYT
jgi:hypothetical protein